MPIDYLLGAAIGTLVAFMFAIPAIVLEIMERGKVKNIPLIVDVKTIFGRKLKNEEVFWVGLLVHVILGTLFGLVYVLFVLKGWLLFTNAPYTLLSLFLYAICAWVVVGIIIFPALGMGLFGRKEGKRVWMELLASMFVLGISMWLLVQFYQPFFFNISM
jgi:hypothetical protein